LARADFDIQGELATYDGRSFCPRCGARLGCFDQGVIAIRICALDVASFELHSEAEN